MKYQKIIVTLCAFLFLACNSNEKSTTESGAQVEETGKDFTKNPFAALGQLKKVSDEMMKNVEKMEEMQKKEPVTPHHFSVLIGLLPKVEGWTSDEPKGESSQVSQWKTSTASGRYKKGSGKEKSTMKVNIVDGSYIPMVYIPFTMMSQFSQESTEGHKKGLKIDGQPAFEDWSKKSKRVELSILIEDRFIVTITGKNVEPAAAREWAGKLDIKKMAKLATQPGKALATAPDEAAIKPEAKKEEVKEKSPAGEKPE